GAAPHRCSAREPATCSISLSAGISPVRVPWLSLPGTLVTVVSRNTVSSIASTACRKWVSASISPPSMTVGSSPVMRRAPWMTWSDAAGGELCSASSVPVVSAITVWRRGPSWMLSSAWRPLAAARAVSLAFWIAAVRALMSSSWELRVSSPSIRHEVRSVRRSHCPAGGGPGQIQRLAFTDAQGEGGGGDVAELGLAAHDDAVGIPGDLHRDLLAAHLDLFELAGADDPLDRMHAHPQAAGAIHQQRGDLSRGLVPDQRGDRDGGSPVLHHDRGQPGIERSVLEQRIDHPGPQPRIQVVHIGLQLQGRGRGVVGIAAGPGPTGLSRRGRTTG